MAIRITEDGVVNYENSPDVNRKLFPNLNICGKEIAELEEEINGKAPAVFSTTSGPIASFDDGADDMPIKSCVVSFDPIQEGEGDPSPENVRAISGRTGLTVYKRGANLVNDSIKNPTPAGTSVYIGGEASAYVHYLRAGTYTLSCDFTDGIHYGAYIKEENTTQIALWTSGSGLDQATFTLPVDGFYRLWFYRNTGVTADGVSNIMLNVGDTALPYEPYKQTENVSVNWEAEAGTVYSGTLDVINGKLVVDSVMYNLNTSTMNNDENYPGWKNTGVKDVIGSGLQTANYSVISNIGKNVAVNTTGSGSGVIYLPTQTYIKTQPEWIAEALDVQILFKSINPVEYQLEPQEIRTLLGENNIWSDAGDVSVDYPADTKTYIDDLSIKTVEVSGQTPTIVAEENTRYICGEVTSLAFTPCEKGICDVRFTVASISTVLTLPETVKLPDWFDPTLLEANTTYEINIVDGIYGAVMSWA